MRGFCVGIACGIFAASSFGQMLGSDVRYYAYANVAHNLIFLGSSESRTGYGFSLAYGRRDPRITIRHKIEGELVWEAYTLETDTKNTSVQFPFPNSRGFGVLATARYRSSVTRSVNILYDFGFGYQFIDHPNRDLPLCNNTTFNFGTGLEFETGNKCAIILGARILHQSNEGRKRPNFGQNLLQYYVGYRF